MTDRDSRINFADIERVQLSIEKAIEGVHTGDVTLSAVSSAGCFCTKASISSLSSACSMAQAMEHDPEVAQAIAILFDRAVDVLGEEGAAEALRSRIPQAILR